MAVIDNVASTIQRIASINNGAQIRFSESALGGVGQVQSQEFGTSGSNAVSLAFTPSLAAAVLIGSDLGLASINFMNTAGVALTTPSIPPGSAWEWSPTLSAQPFGALPIIGIIVVTLAAATTVQAVILTS
jgi:hypothetical protein